MIYHLKDEDKKTLKNYKYTGCDSSLTYKYVLSPFAQFCVDSFIPIWMAPNLVTLLALIGTFIVFVLTLILNPTLSDTIQPRWLSFLVGILIFFYQTLDNMDGKQARKTDSSSALGMIFDHGCDAVNAGILAISVGGALGTGWDLDIFLGLWCSFVPFYFQTWEEHYVGEMVLPLFNGPSEGLLFSVYLCFCSAYNGASFYHKRHEIPKELLDYMSLLGISKLEDGYTYFELVYIGGISIAVVTALVQIRTVYSIVLKKNKSLIQPILDLLPFLVFYPSCIYYCKYSEVAFPKYPLLTMLLMCSIHVEGVVNMMLMHILKKPYLPFKRYGHFLMSLFPVLISVKKDFKTLNEEIILIFSSLFAILLTASMLTTLYMEMADSLDIYIFSLKKREKKSM